VALQKQNIPINFAQGLDTKTDPLQVAIGRFLALQNTIFDKNGRLTKRNGFGRLPSLPNTNSTVATTFNGNLTAVGNNLLAYSKGSASWVDKGPLQPLELEALPLNRSNTNQTQADAVVAPNGFVCTVFTDNIPSGGSTTPSYKYSILDSSTGQNIVNPTPIPVPSGTVTGAPRVFLLGRYFILLFNNVITGTTHLQYIAINYANPTSVTTATDISTQVTANARLNYDGVVVGETLFIAWNGNDGGGAIRMSYLASTLTQGGTQVFAGEAATIMNLCADTSGVTPIIYAAFYNSSGTTGKVIAVNQNLSTVLAATTWISSGTVLNITGHATAGVLTIFYELDNAYSYNSAIKTNLIYKKTCTQAGVVSSATLVSRELGLASKAFIVNDIVYMLTVYNSSYQPTYFLINSDGDVVSKLAYSNAGSYYATGLPNVTVNNNVAQMCYLRKSLVTSINREQGATNSAGIYSQTGVNLVSFTIGTTKTVTAEIGGNLNLSGGFIWAYDGVTPVEQGFHLWPDYVEVDTDVTGGLITAQQYYYIAVYEWNDAQGNTHRSAPSLPAGVVTTGATSSNTVNVPTLRLTYKVDNPVRIVLYRWSTAQQTYYQITSITAPLLNDPTVDSVAYVDTAADSSILGNTILYTTGGVIENIAAPACRTIGLFKSRLLAVSAEDENLLLYSKQVIQGTPVEMSDLLTIYVAPTTSAQNSTGGVKVIAPMDDKAILWKKNAIYYITGTGPDNTGANNDFSDPTFITSTVGCENQQSVVFIPQGLMFQSDKGIWLLDRSLNTTYIGAAVEDFTKDATVLSAVNIPGTNQVRFTLDSGVTLMYDYFYGQWGTFVNVPAVSSTIYEDLHTYINSFGRVFQETPGAYLDGSSPVLIKFTTSWINIGGLQGFERAYFFYILAQYLSPHKLTVQIAYDYNPSPTQSSVITPDNYSPNYGGEAVWGSGAGWGGPGKLEQWRVFLAQQKCQAFQITIMESFDATQGQPAGAGFTMSGLDLTIGLKDGRPRLKASRSVG
jgi:hypothetical protein